MTPLQMAQLQAACFSIPRPWTEQEFATFLGDPACFFATVPHGFSLGRVVLDEAELLTIAVDIASRRRGVGRTLVTAFETGARARGAKVAFLEVAADNSAALALYQALGFSQVGVRPGYYAGTDALVFRKSLSLGASE